MSNIIGDRFSITDDEEEGLKEYLRHELHNLHTAQPCEVVGVNKQDGTVSVKLGVRRDITGESVDVFVLKRVPVMFQSSGKFKMTFPIEAGDTGLIIFCESSIDRWLTRGQGSRKEYHNPLDTRMHDYSDGVFIPGLKRYAESCEITDDACIGIGASKITMKEDGEICLENENSKITMKDDGKVCIEGAEGDILSLIVKALDLINPSAGGAASAQIGLLKLMICEVL